MKLSQVFYSILVLTILVIGCQHDPTIIAEDCKVVGVTYENYIKYINQDHCLNCHATGHEQPYLDTYPQMMVIVNDGRLVQVITHSSGAIPMPFNSAPLPDCMIQNIISWVDNGAPEM